MEGCIATSGGHIGGIHSGVRSNIREGIGGIHSGVRSNIREGYKNIWRGT